MRVFEYRQIITLFCGISSLVFASALWAKPVNLYEQPKTDSKVVGTIDSGSSMVPIISNPDGDWMKVGDPLNGNVGWLKVSEVSNSSNGATNTGFSMSQTINGPKTYRTVQFSNPKSLTPAEAKAFNEQMQKRQADIQKNAMEMIQNIFDNANAVYKANPDLYYEFISIYVCVYCYGSRYHMKETTYSILAGILLIVAAFFTLILPPTLLHRTKPAVVGKNKQKLGAVPQSQTIGMAYISLRWRCVKVNKLFCHVLGYSARELLKMDFQRLIHPDDFKNDWPSIQKILAGHETTHQSQQRYLDKNGDLIAVSVTMSLCRNKEGKPLYFICQLQIPHTLIPLKKSAEKADYSKVYTKVCP